MIASMASSVKIFGLLPRDFQPMQNIFMRLRRSHFAKSLQPGDALFKRLKIRLGQFNEEFLLPNQEHLHKLNTALFKIIQKPEALQDIVGYFVYLIYNQQALIALVIEL